MDVHRPPSGRDPQLGTLFQTMRAALSASPTEAAALLGTTTQIVAALELGDLEQLPPWPETARIVGRYGELLRIDVGSALLRLKQALAVAPTQRAAAALPFTHVRPPITRAVAHPPSQQDWPRAQSTPTFAGQFGRPTGAMSAAPHEAAVATFATPPTTHLPQRGVPTTGDDDDAAVSSPAYDRLAKLAAVQTRLAAKLAAWERPKMQVRWPTRRKALLVGLPAGFLLATVLAVTTLPSGLRAGLGLLPDGLTKSMRAQVDRVNQRVTIGSDGLKWIVVSDPRSRKADRLPVSNRP